MRENRESAPIDELMRRWEESHAQGQTLTPEEMAAGAPELVADLARRIDAFRARGTAIPSGLPTVEQSPPVEPGPWAELGRLTPAREFTTVGHLKEPRFHARGGLGEVFVVCEKELDRQVALKRIRPDRFHGRVRERFLREAAIMARLQHPGIVPIHALGEDGEGPFYTMPFIEGETLQEAIHKLHENEAGQDPSRRGLALKNLLRRFITVCDTMAYAHDQGVVHRDLKPSNIMLGPYGETFVMDWGLAKRYIGESDEADPLDELPDPSPSPGDLTAIGAVLGTPQYMSPEQDSGRPVGRASDLYSLGVILYAILTSKSPYHESPPSDPLKPVREAALVPPRQHDANVPRALEAICLRAMAAQPLDRYATARDLGEDVARWLADEPVSAYRDGISARLGRWARRHRASVQAAALALLVIAVLASTAAVIVDQARRRVEIARSRATQSLAAEQVAKAEAQANLSIAGQAVNDYFTKISENALLKRQDAAQVRDLRTLRKELLEVALDYYNRLATWRSIGPALRAEQAAAFMRVGRINEEIGSKEAALAAYQQGREIRTELAAKNPGDSRLQRELALDLIDVAAMLADIGHASESLTDYAQSQAILERLAQSDPVDSGIPSDLARALIGAGVVLRSLSRPEDALATYERARSVIQQIADAHSATVEDQRRLATAHANIGLLLNEMGRPDDAIAALEKSRLIDQSLIDADPNSSSLQSDLASCCNNLGLVYSNANRPAESLAALARGRAIYERLVRDHASVTEYRRDLATNHINSGNVHSWTGQPS
jgi:serine/threonine-protein kinase